MRHSKHWQHIQAAWNKLSGVDIRVLELFDYYHRTFGYIFPSQATIARKLEISERTVRRSIADLKEMGLIVVQQRHFRNRLGQIRSQSNVYRLLTLVGCKIRRLLNCLAPGRPKKAHATKTGENKELFCDFSKIKNVEMREILERWKARGEK
jgi:biotin operon repressor